MPNRKALLLACLLHWLNKDDVSLTHVVVNIVPFYAMCIQCTLYVYL